MAAIVHLDVTVWMLIRLVEYDDIADLRNIRLWRHDLRAVPLQEWPVIAGIARLRAVCVPYNGAMTTGEAIWMGVPVVFFPGETFAARHGLSFLSNAGLRELVAADVSGYVSLAVELAHDIPRLAELRGGLRERVAGSRLCDGKRFAADLMAVLRDIWQRWILQGQK